MATMLPVLTDNSPSLADVLTSSVAAILGRSNRLGLPPVRSAVIVVVDGLGSRNLAARTGHARFLSRAVRQGESIASGFPSTTAAMLATLATGAKPGAHGMTGYDVWDRRHSRVLNLLRGWDAHALPEEWQALPTVFERAGGDGLASHVVMHPQYADSGFTRATLRGAQFHGQKSVADRVRTAIEILRSPQPALVYLYVPELDAASHRFGWESDEWLAWLESVDADLSILDDFLRTEPELGLLVTADHGSIDVPADNHEFFDQVPGLLDGISAVAGEPRCLQLTLADPSGVSSVAARWRAAYPSAWIFTPEDAVASGWWDTSTGESLPDLFIAAQELIAFYDSRDPRRVGRTMIGQHGSLTPEELEVPLLRSGAFSVATQPDSRARKPRHKSAPSQ